MNYNLSQKTLSLQGMRNFFAYHKFAKQMVNQDKEKYLQGDTPKISVVILHTVLPYSSCDWRIGIGSTNNLLIDISIHSHHMPV